MISRRGTMTGVAAAAAAAALAGTLKFLHPFSPHYPPTQYDDLLAQLTDREAGTRLGTAVLAATPDFDIGTAAAKLRASLVSRTLTQAVAEDVRKDHLIDVNGWLLPESLALLCAIAAKAG